MKNIKRKNLLRSRQVTFDFQAEPKKFKKYHKIKYKTTKMAISSKIGGLTSMFTKHACLFTQQVLSILKFLKPAMKEHGYSRILLPLMRLDTTVTKKPKDIRMGRGKGVPSERCFVTASGSLVASYYGMSILGAKVLSRGCSAKLSDVALIEVYK